MNKDGERESLGALGVVGTILAGLVSWTYTHNFWWTLFHLLFGWLYLIGRALMGLPLG